MPRCTVATSALELPIPLAVVNFENIIRFHQRSVVKIDQRPSVRAMDLLVIILRQG